MDQFSICNVLLFFECLIFIDEKLANANFSCLVRCFSFFYSNCTNMIKKLILAAAVSLLFTACSEPRGPLEVEGKIFIDKNYPIQLEFSSYEKGEITNLEKNETKEFKYTLKGEDLAITILNDDGSEGQTAELTLDGIRYRGDANLNIAEFTEKDEKRVEEVKEKAKKEEEARKIREKELAEEKKRLSPVGSPQDADAYTDVSTIADENNDWQAWMIIAANAKAVEDDEKLRMLSGKWYNTRDTFERQAMRESELARINEKLVEVAKIKYIKMASRALGRGGVNLDPRTSSYDQDYSYNFEKKSFKLKGSLCDGGTYRSESNYKVELVADEAFCVLPIADESKAREIEALRVKNRLEIGQDTYFKVITASKENGIKLVPVGVTMKPYVQTYKRFKDEDLLATIPVWPYK